MKTIAFILFNSLIFFYSSAQTALTLKNISLDFPDKYVTKEVQGLTVFVMSKDSVTYQVMVYPKTTLKISSEVKFNEYLNATTKGFVESIGTDFKSRITDTTMGGARGKFLHLYEPTQQHKFNEGYCFLTYIDDQAFFVNAFIYGSIDNIYRKRIEDFFKSVKFEGKQY